MKQGRTLEELAGEVLRQTEQKKDYVADTRAIRLHTVPTAVEDESTVPDVALAVDGIGDFGLKSVAHRQLATRVKIPAIYYDKCRESAPELLAENVNHWLAKNPERRLLRTLDNDVRAILSNSYRPLDNYDLATAVLPAIQDVGAKVESCELTESSMYLKVVSDKLVGDTGLGLDPKVGDPVKAGLVISNSEVGHGSLRIELFVYRLVCTNGMIVGNSLRKNHVGRAQEGLENSVALWTDATKKVSDEAFWAQVRDVVQGSLTEEGLNGIIAKIREVGEQKVTGDPIKAVEVVANRFRFTEGEKSNVLRHLVEGGRLDRWGVTNAVTRTAEDIEDYDRATEFERFGGKVIELPRRDWDRIAVAA